MEGKLFLFSVLFVTRKCTCLCYADATVQLCDFHREQAWLRWINTSRNNVDADDKDQLLAMLRSIAHSQTTEKYTAALDFLMRSRIWKSNTALQNWFSHKWLSHCKACMLNAGIFHDVDY